MKKIIKIACLSLIFILLILGITTSNAVDFTKSKFPVDVDTTADEMLDAIKAGKNLTSIGYDVVFYENEDNPGNDDIICIGHGIPLWER